jgi:hypothetical protein
MVILLISIRFDSVELPNGSYLSHRRFLSLSQDDVVLRRNDGSILVEEGIALVCFNGSYVQGYTVSGGKSSFYQDGARLFIYEKGEDAAVFEDDPGFADVQERSGLTRFGSCGIEGSWKNFHVLLQDPKYRR